MCLCGGLQQIQPLYGIFGVFGGLYDYGLVVNQHFSVRVIDGIVITIFCASFDFLLFCVYNSILALVSSNESEQITNLVIDL